MSTKIARLWALVLFMVLGRLSEGARILSYLPYPVRSHSRISEPLLRALALRGHNVTSYSPFPMENPPPNYREVLTPDYLNEIKETIDMRALDNLWSLKAFSAINDLAALTGERAYGNKAFQDLLSSQEEFDVVIDTSAIIQETSAALQHRFGAISVLLLPVGSGYYNNFLVGNPVNPSYMVDYTAPLTDRMDFFQRVFSTMIYLRMTLGQWLFHYGAAQKRVDSYARYPGSEERPHFTDLIANKSLVLVNTHISMNYGEPYSPHVIDIGGISILPEKPLPKDIKQFMDESEEGVVYFSFGGNIEVSKVLRGDLLKAFTGPLGKLKQRVLWKWETDNFPEKPENVKISKWFPQHDILRHKNCKLFITHGGFNGLMEAVDSGVPVLGIPLFIDQRKNLLHAESKNYGIMIEFKNITQRSISWAVNEILTDPTYREAAQTRSEIFRDRPMSPVDTAVYWIEYVIRHRGAPHLRTMFNKLPWYKSMLIDVAAFLIAIMLFVVCLTYRLLKSAVGSIFGKKPIKEKIL